MSSVQLSTLNAFFPFCHLSYSLLRCLLVFLSSSLLLFHSSTQSVLHFLIVPYTCCLLLLSDRSFFLTQSDFCFLVCRFFLFVLLFTSSWYLVQSLISSFLVYIPSTILFLLFLAYVAIAQFRNYSRLTLCYLLLFGICFLLHYSCHFVNFQFLIV